MYDYGLRANLKTFRVDADDDGPTIKRTCRMTFEMMLDGGIARAVGGDFGADALQALRDLTTTKVEFPIDAIKAKAKLVGIAGTTPVRLDEVVGIKAVASVKKPKEDGESEPPKAKMEFESPYSDELCIFLGRNSGAWIELTLTKNQLELALDKATGDLKAPPPPGTQVTVGGPGWSVPLLTKEQAATAAAAVGEIGEALDHEKEKRGPWRPRLVDGGVGGQDERDVHETAETPEEAETMREARLAHREGEAEPKEEGAVATNDEGLAF